jgi:ubiquinone/menaquinone biosynthesis C-methylase UbiE
MIGQATIETRPATLPGTEEIRESWSRIAGGYDEFVTPTHTWLGEEGLRRAGLRPGMRFLDVAAGSGALSIPAARLGARVLATDLSPQMLARLEARARKEGLAVETRVMDGHDLELEDGIFDLAGSQFGVMLFPDMPRGVRELARVTKPGGRVLMNVFGDPRKVEFFGFLIAALQAAVPSFQGPPMDPPPLPFQLQDPEALRSELAKAGLKDIRIETVSEKLECPSGAALWDWLLHSNPIVGAILGELSLAPSKLGVVSATLERMVRSRAGAGGTTVLTAPINIGVGTK